MSSNEQKLDVGVIVDGVVGTDPNGGTFIQDSEGVKFYPLVELQKLSGKDVRLTLISADSIKEIAKVLSESSGLLDVPV
jgi:hypothetical protein